MTNLDTSRGTTVASDDTAHSRPYVDWGAIFAGATVAAAIALALTTFGSAIGLTMTSPYPSSGLSGKAVAIAAAIWAVWIGASASIAGGYLAGRLRHRALDSTQHESEVRNGSHGLVVWAVAALIAGTLGIFALGSGKSGTWMAPGASTSPEIVERATDSLLRSERGVPNEGLKRQMSPLLEKAAAGRQLAGDERSFLARMTATQTGVSTDDANRRVDATVTSLRDDINAARRLALLAAFITAAALAVGAAAAWFGATLGGKHRDEGTGVAWFGGTPSRF